MSAAQTATEVLKELFFYNQHTHTHTCKALWSPLIVGDVQVFVDGEEGLFEEDNPPALFILRLVEDGLHLLHVARSVAVHLLQDFLVAGTDLKTFRHTFTH